MSAAGILASGQGLTVGGSVLLVLALLLVLPLLDSRSEKLALLTSGVLVGGAILFSAGAVVRALGGVVDRLDRLRSD